MNRSCGIKVVKYSRPRAVRWMVNYTVWQFIFLSARWCLETSSERDSYCWLAKHVIAKVFLILLLSCACRKHIDITRVIRTIEEGICSLERMFLGMFALLGPITRERTWLRHSDPDTYAAHFQLSTWTIRASQTADFYYRRINKRCSSSILRSSINALLTIVLSPLNIFSPGNKRREE